MPQVTNRRHCSGRHVFSGDGQKHLRNWLLHDFQHREASGPFPYGLLTTIGWKLGDEVTYALEGSASLLVRWCNGLDGLELFSDAAETESMALSVSDSGGVFVVPAFAV